MNDGSTEARRRQIEDALTSSEDASIWTIWRKGASSADEAFDQAYRDLMVWARVDPAGALRVSTILRSRGMRGLDPPRRARFWRVHAHVLRANAHLKDASKHYERAVRTFERHGDLLEAGRTAIGWIDALSLLGLHQQALGIARQARRRLARADAATRARLQSNIGTLHHHLGQYTLAVASYRGARTALRRAEHATDLALVDFNLGQSLLQLGRVREAQRCFGRSLEEFERRRFTAQALRARFAAAVATLYLGNWDTGTQQLAEVGERLAALGDAQAEGAIRWEMSRVYGAFGDVQAAEREARAAHATYTRLGIVRDAAHLALLHARWLVALDRFSDAQVQLEVARTYFLAVRDRRTVRQIEVERASILVESGRPDLARIALGTVRTSSTDVETTVRAEILRARLDLEEGSPAVALRRVRRALDRARGFPHKLHRPAIVLVGASALAALGRSSEAARWAKRATQEVDRLAAGTSEDLLRRPLWSMRDRIVREAVRLVLEHGGRHAARDALDLLSRAHSRDLIEDLLQQMPRLAPQLRARIAQLRERLLREESGPQGDVRVRVLARDIDHLDRVLRRRLTRDVDVVRRATEQARLASWRARIPRGAAVVVFDQGESRCSAFVVDRDEVRHVALPHADLALRESWRPLQLLFEAASAMPTERRARFLDRTRAEADAALGALGAALWDPLQVCERRVHLVLPPSLHALPMESIGGGSADAECVVSRWPHPSLIRTDRAVQGGAAVLIHDGSEGTRAEVDAVARALAESGFAVGVDCGRGGLSDHARVRVFHVAGHGSVAYGHWVGTGIQLADGWLGLEEVAGERRFRDALLYFASCGSAQRSLHAQGRFDGWAAAGLSSGAREVVGALWKIDDSAARAFSEAFYPLWARTGDAARAATETRARLRAAGAHPYQWSPFSVVG